MTKLSLKRNDRSPSLAATLYQQGGAAVIDLTNCTVAFHARDRQSGTVAINAAATVTDAAGGGVRYDWTTGDVDASGDFDIEWEVTLPSGKTVTVPNDGYDRLLIIDDLA